jgi:hypothetical protein
MSARSTLHGGEKLNLDIGRLHPVKFPALAQVSMAQVAVDRFSCLYAGSLPRQPGRSGRISPANTPEIEVLKFAVVNQIPSEWFRSQTCVHI